MPLCQDCKLFQWAVCAEIFLYFYIGKIPRKCRWILQISYATDENNDRKYRDWNDLQPAGAFLEYSKEGARWNRRHWGWGLNLVSNSAAVFTVTTGLFYLIFNFLETLKGKPKVEEELRSFTIEPTWRQNPFVQDSDP